MQHPTGNPSRALGAEIVDLVERYHYDREAALAWARKHRGYADSLSELALHGETRLRLTELASSHCEIYTPDDPGYPHLLALFEHILLGESAYDSIGLEVALIDGEWFAIYVFPEGPAARAGILRGDRMVHADGQPFHPVLSFRSRSGQTVNMTVGREAGGARRALAVVPSHISPPEEWWQIQERSTTLIPVKARKIGYSMLWCCGGEEPEQMLREALSHDLLEADALILDFRGGWGGCNPSLLDVIRPRSGGRDRTLVLLVDRRTRSGKEVVARLVQKRRWGALVGERTAGAVARGRPFLLQDGSVLYLAVEDYEIEGERLEGQGVEPDLRAPSDPRYSAGRDVALQAALNLICNT